MKLKLCLLLMTFTVGSVSLSAELNNRYNQANRPAKTVSSIVRSSIYDKDTSYADYSLIIDEYKTRVENYPDNYALRVPLIDAYIKSQDYNSAFDELSFLLSQKDNDQLSVNIVNRVNKLRVDTIDLLKYKKDKSPIYANLALMSLICDNTKQAEQYVKYSVSNVIDADLILKTIRFVMERTGNFDEAVAISNLYMSLNRTNADEARKMKIYFLTRAENLNAVISEYQKILQNGDDLDDEQKYELFKLLAVNDASDKKILTTLFSKNGNNLEQSYYDLYNLLMDFDDTTGADLYAAKIAKEYPQSVFSDLMKADKFIKENKTDEALNLLNTVRSKVSTDNEITMFNRLMAELTKQPLEEAIKLVQQGYPQKAFEILQSKNVPDTEYSLAVRARCCMELGQMQQALEYLNKAIALDPNNLAVNLQFGYYYLYNGDYELARKYAENAYELEPDEMHPSLMLIEKLNRIDSDKYINKIISAFDAQNYSEAMRIINNALKIDAKSSVLYYYKGLTYIAQNNYAASTAALYKSIELDETNVLAYYFLGIAFDNLSEPVNALTYYKRFLQLLPADEYGESEKVDYAKSRIKKLQGVR